MLQATTAILSAALFWLVALAAYAGIGLLLYKEMLCRGQMEPMLFVVFAWPLLVLQRIEQLMEDEDDRKY